MKQANDKPIRTTSTSSTTSHGGSTHSNGSYESLKSHAPLTGHQRYRIRLFAANLPNNRNMLRGRNPNTLAIVTSPAIDHKYPHSRSTSIASSSSKGSLLDEYPVGESITESVHETSSPISMQEWGRTEVVYNSRHPQWTDTILFDCNHVSKQNTFFYVHLFSESPELKSYGTALYHVNDILSNPRRTRVRRLRTGGCLFCRLEPVANSAHQQQRIRFQFQATDLPKSHLQQQPTTLLEVAQRQPDTSWLTVYRSTPVFHSTEPSYDPLDMELGALCGGDHHRPLRFTLFRVVRRQRRSVWSIAETTLQHILRKNDTVLTLLKDASIYQEMGRLRVTEANVYTNELASASTISERSVDRLWEEPDRVVEVVDLEQIAELPPSPGGGSVKPFPVQSFASYLEQGCVIDFCVAIDFTSSNGDPRLDKEDSHHHLGTDGSMNDYEETIFAIGSAMEKYSKSQEYAVWGFGAKYGGDVKHIFQCGQNETVHAVDGMLTAYQSVFERDLVMSGPTVFTDVIRAAGSRAHKARHDKHYRVLLIITDDGIMDNYAETRDMLQFFGQHDPLSVIFVGVGRSDFSTLKRLCSETPRTAFVEFRCHNHDPAALGEAALRDLPSQLCQYMQANNI